MKFHMKSSYLDPDWTCLVSTLGTLLGRCHISMGIAWRVDLSGALSTPCWHLAATWTPAIRACFEQGALAFLLYLPGIVPVFTMFQSTCIQEASGNTACLWGREIAYGSHASTSAAPRLDPHGICDDWHSEKATCVGYRRI